MVIIIITIGIIKSGNIIGEHLRHLLASNAMRINNILQILNNARSEIDICKHFPFFDTLNCSGDLTQKSQLSASKTDLLALEIGNFESQFHDKVVVNEGGSWSW